MEMCKAFALGDSTFSLITFFGDTCVEGDLKAVSWGEPEIVDA